MSVRSFALKSMAFPYIIAVYGTGNWYETITARCVMSLIIQPSLYNVSLTIRIKRYKRISDQFKVNKEFTNNVLRCCAGDMREQLP